MNQQAVPQDGSRMRQVDPHRLAWGVLLIAFAAFCLLCVAGVLAVDFFLFQSSVPMEPVLSLGRGTVGLTNLSSSLEQVGRNNAAISPGMVVSTDPQSQGTILFYDTTSDEVLLASVTLSNGSSATLRGATRPRFEWSRTQPVISLTDVIGELSVEVPETSSKEVMINVQTGAGTLVTLQGPGEYIVNANAEQVTVFNRQGEAVLIPQDRQMGHFVPVDGMGTLTYADNSFSQNAGYVDLLADSGFEHLRDGTGETGGPGWVCGSDPGDNPAGHHEFVWSDGMSVLRFFRGDGATSHGRTSCAQSFGQSGLDIQDSGFNYLSLSATLNIEYQSLSVCGFVDGSECPLMLRMDYIDANGDAQRWHHGLYAREAGPQSNYPLRCDTCLQDHDLVYGQAWYTYRSSNLLTLFNPDPAPASVVAIWFYASGHEFDVRVSNVSLIGAHLDLESEEANLQTIP